MKNAFEYMHILNFVFIVGFSLLFYYRRIGRFQSDDDDDDEQALWKQFLTNCNENLHIALLMKPNAAFRVYCRQYPGLIGSTTINYMHPWSEQVLNKVANVFLAQHPIIVETYLDAIINHVVYVHQSVHSYSRRYFVELMRPNFVTPKHYVEYIHNYIRLMGKYSLPA